MSSLEHAVGLAENQRGELVETERSHQLTTGGGKPGQGYPAARVGTRVRRLTPLECERLMSWPDDHTRYGITADGVDVELPDSVRYRQCGNGVVANVAWWIAMQLNAAVEAER